jgi:lipopolysaccharide transport system ATP-binding protein
MTAVALRVEGLGKRYRTGMTASHGRLSEALYHVPRALARRRSKARLPSEIVWALRDVSLEVEEGEVVGVIGRNGAGKSTLLKILAGITEPTEGRVGINGRVGSLLEVGTGFHPELTGRENIFLNGAILGMRRREIRRRFDEIVEFAETGAFLDTPVKRYSSGMYVRLAFAVAAHLEPEILIVDEVLAVGDTAFQQKCLGKMGDVARSGRTVLFVSHNMMLVSALCSTCHWLDGGRVVARGATDDTIQAYLGAVRDARTSPLAERVDRRGNGHLRFTAVIAQSPGGPTSVGDPVTFTVNYETVRALRDVEVALVLRGPLGEPLVHLSSELDGRTFTTADSGPGSVICSVPELPLIPGAYSIDVFASAGYEVLDFVENAATLEVFASNYLGHGRLPHGSKGGPFVLRQSWSDPE